MCEQFKLKIALDNRDNAVGFVRVPRAYKLSDVREQIIRDELLVPSRFAFTEDGTTVTRRQEENWDVETYLSPENNGICVIRTVKEQTDIEEGRYSTETEEETQAMLKDRQPCCNELTKTWGEKNLTRTVDIIGDDLSERVTSLRSWAAVATAAPPPPASADYTVESTGQTQVYIGNLVTTINNKKARFSDDELKLDYVYQFGQVKDYNRPVDHYAFVAFAYHESAEACVEELNNRVIGSFKVFLTCRKLVARRLRIVPLSLERALAFRHATDLDLVSAQAFVLDRALGKIEPFTVEQTLIWQRTMHGTRTASVSAAQRTRMKVATGEVIRDFPVAAVVANVATRHENGERKIKIHRIISKVDRR